MNENVKKLSDLSERFLFSMSKCGVNGYQMAKEHVINSQSTLTKIKQGIQEPSKKMIDLYCEKYNVNKAWLYTGEGNMLNDVAEKPETPLEIVPAAKSNSCDGIPVYNIDATCGTDYRDIDFTDENVIGCVSLPSIRKGAVVIRANGDSMVPIIHDGDFVVIRQIHSWEDLFYGQIYLLLLDEYRMIKFVRRYEPDEDNYIILRSENPKYDDIKLAKNKIRKLFIVENILSVKAQL